MTKRFEYNVSLPPSEVLERLRAETVPFARGATKGGATKGPPISAEGYESSPPEMGGAGLRKIADTDAIAFVPVLFRSPPSASCRWSERWRASTSAANRTAPIRLARMEHQIAPLTPRTTHLALHPHKADGGEAVLGHQLLANHLGLHRHKADGGQLSASEQIRAKSDHTNSPVLRRPGPPISGGLHAHSSTEMAGPGLRWRWLALACAGLRKIDRIHFRRISQFLFRVALGFLPVA
jgi:hypothetical protein